MTLRETERERTNLEIVSGLVSNTLCMRNTFLCARFAGKVQRLGVSNG